MSKGEGEREGKGREGREEKEGKRRKRRKGGSKEARKEGSKEGRKKGRKEGRKEGGLRRKDQVRLRKKDRLRKKKRRNTSNPPSLHPRCTFVALHALYRGSLGSGLPLEGFEDPTKGHAVALTHGAEALPCLQAPRAP